MIATQERISQRGIFYAIRLLVQELHAEKAILEDVHGAPFLFKSQDAQVWVRIFYRSMQDFSIDELKLEIKKLWVLMPREAVLYLFFPSLDREQILKMNGISDRLSFFEYGHWDDPETDKSDIRICKWIPGMALSGKLVQEEPKMAQAHPRMDHFLQRTRLNKEEVADLTELILSLRQM